jgi:hypothetical protein
MTELADSVLEDQLISSINAIVAVLTAEDSPQALSPPPGRVVPFYPGTTAAWDSCCDGQLSFNLVSMTAKLGQAGPSMRQPCAVLWWEAVVVVKILRCAAVVSNQGTAPSPTQINDNGMQSIQDMRTILEVIKNMRQVSNVASYAPVGPEGGCTGGTWQFTLRLDGDPCF